MTDDDVLATVGPRLRALRTERGSTLSDVAATTGISVSTLSRLESGGRRPTLELLLPLARAYGVAIDDLVDTPAPADPRVHGRPIEREDGMTMVPLTRQTGGLQSFKMILPARWRVTETDQKTHEGYEWLYVLSGRIRLLLGARDFVLGQGEVVEFDTRVPHTFSNPFPEPAEALVLFGPQGERMHVRARPATGAQAERA
ncbi:helix-turn-helix transcriptional regulator [Blastococcus sp. MG754426]|uniref:helix-turn-helix domain-containing protein n=1 Tax=unclassified Blastococcus TaxID=2619396 RepID=UPI001EF0C9D8|nr:MULTISPECIES: XRE family transcriptional regulator [unclassified Blastococcus]MCF6508901.1 helix-turn-helix transcriptional regulator [Blastococcus sp. MG754426]MCF6513182.1 helix-turn-helix transcriptional regulator [Blastococcus sp. MG754427]MCF6736188.1 helix-turn-helix transcriptional regulator [Blastococcus sp. KM273129]